MTIHEFKDTYIYACKSWLRIELAETQLDELTATGAASAYLFHKLVLNEDRGKEITMAAIEIPAKALREKATQLRLKMAGTDLLQGGTAFRDYFLWIRDAVAEAKLAGLDNESLLVLSVADEVVDIILKGKPKVAPTLVSEVIYLYTVDFFRGEMLTSCRDHYRTLRSYPFFEATVEEFERIRSEILD